MTDQDRTRFLRQLRRSITDSQHPYVLYWAPGCQYSERARELLEAKCPGQFDSYPQQFGVKGVLLGLFEEIADQIEFPSSHRTWPMVFHRGRFLGGYTELAEHLR